MPIKFTAFSSRVYYTVLYLGTLHGCETGISITSNLTQAAGSMIAITIVSGTGTQLLKLGIHESKLFLHELYGTTQALFPVLQVQTGHTLSIAYLVFLTFQNTLRQNCIAMIMQFHTVLFHMPLQISSVFLYKLLQLADTALHTVDSVGALFTLSLSTLQLTLQLVSLKLSTLASLVQLTYLLHGRIHFFLKLFHLNHGLL